MYNNFVHHRPGFSYENVARNTYLESSEETSKLKPDKYVIGATVVGVLYEDGVIIGSDTRCTKKNIIPNNNMVYSYELTKNVVCSGSGYGADLYYIAKMAKSQAEIIKLHKNRECSVENVANILGRILYTRQGNDIGANYVVGGCDSEFQLYRVGGDGSVHKNPYISTGGGEFAAISILESRWHKKMNLNEAKALVRDAVSSGIMNQLQSGNKVKMWIAEKHEGEMLVKNETVNIIENTPTRRTYTYERHTTKVISETVTPIIEQSPYIPMGTCLSKRNEDK